MTDLTQPPSQHHLMQRIVETFLQGNLSAMLIVLSLIAGAVALWTTPREEEPQIVVPLADVMVSVPGASAREVERQVATRLEKLLYQIDGVEYVYSMSRPNAAIVTVRFFVGENREQSLIKLYNKIMMNQDAVPPTVAGWVVKPVEIDDVPIVGITLSSGTYSDAELRRIAEELDIRLQSVPNTGRTQVIGGRPRQVRVMLDPEKMSSRGLGMDAIERALRGANVMMPAGTYPRQDREFVVDAGKALVRPDEVANLVVAVDPEMHSPIYLKDIATVGDAPAEADSHVGFYVGADAPRQAAVTLAVAKKRGSNAVWVSRDIQAKLRELAPVLLPSGVDYTVTRDYGKTANDKVNDLVEGLAVAIVIVVALLALAMGWREAMVVAAAVPVTFALTLIINELAGYSINRVTLFALTLALGLVVDDPIVDVENIHRHLRMGKRKALDAVLEAVNEVRPPIILATLAVIVSFVPMFFITGMMGPYMRPMALNVPLAMLMSMVVAFTITPWMSWVALKGQHAKGKPQSDASGDTSGGDEAAMTRGTWLYKFYAAVASPFLARRKLAWTLMLVTCGLFVLSCLLVATRRVPLKMLPFDNKNEFQVVVDMPEGTTLERTAAVTDALAQHLRRQSEVTHVTTYVGLSSPMDFNGLVRHYYLRQGSNVADIRVNLIDKDDRAQQSHAMVLRLRLDMAKLAESLGANVKIVEMPPGPPVISTVTVEVYGQPFHDYSRIQEQAKKVEDRLRREPGVVDVDSTVEAEQTRWIFVTDKEKAALAGLSTQAVAQTLAAALGGKDIATLHDENEVNPLPIRLQLPLADRSDIAKLENLYMAAPGGMVQLREVGKFEQSVVDQTIYHKNLRPVVYVFGEMAGRSPAEAVLACQGSTGVDPAFPVEWAGEGEWKITVDVFRDLGIAFAAACLGIYVLLVYETGSFFMPVILMISIPLTVIGIMPGFWLLNVFGGGPVAGVGSYANPVFFTATAMIGMIALSGIAVRNAILLIDFIHVAQRRGQALKQAILDSGAVRMRPIFLTAGTSVLAAIPITLDPIFSGLAWALIFGLFVSTAFTLLIIPVVYWMIYGERA
ncbi:MAG: efflux RND transporter permease subunit [Phycisphaeraceae bacterium]|nr:efflux RND transporter permease subunit [Phycisphaeraceae bacterium]